MYTVHMVKSMFEAITTIKKNVSCEKYDLTQLNECYPSIKYCSLCARTAGKPVGVVSQSRPKAFGRSPEYQQ